VERERDEQGDQRSRGEADQLRGQRRPALAHDDEHHDGDEAYQQGPRIDAVMRDFLAAAFGAAVGAEHFGQLVDDERDREARHQPGDHRVGHEARDVAEAQHPEQHLDHAGEGEAGGGEEHDLVDAAGRRRAQRRVAGDAQDERREQEHGRRARHLVRQQRSAQHERGQRAEDRSGQRRAQAGLHRVFAERRERDEAEGQHHRDEHERGGDAGAGLACEIGQATAFGGDRRAVIDHRFMFLADSGVTRILPDRT
jgi:hypothetical protein